MISFAPSSAERRLSTPPSAWQRRLLGAAAMGLAWAAAPAAHAAASALETCDAGSVDDAVLRLCLEGLAAEVAQDLEQVLDRSAAYFDDLDAITGNERASRTLARAQTAYALFRDLDCDLVAIDQGIGRAAVDRALACRIDHDTRRIASLVALIGDPEPEPRPEQTAAPLAAQPLLDTSWRVVAIDGEAVADEIEITLAIDDDGSVTGIGGCNRYSATAEIGAEGGSSIGTVGATRMACDEATMARESRYFSALERVAGFSLDDDELTLSDADDEVLVRLQPQAD